MIEAIREEGILYFQEGMRISLTIQRKKFRAFRTSQGRFFGVHCRDALMGQPGTSKEIQKASIFVWLKASSHEQIWDAWDIMKKRWSTPGHITWAVLLASNPTKMSVFVTCASWQLTDVTVQHWEKLILIAPYESLTLSFRNYPIKKLNRGVLPAPRKAAEGILVFPGWGNFWG